jgi:hypothetical protein
MAAVIRKQEEASGLFLVAGAVLASALLLRRCSDDRKPAVRRAPPRSRAADAEVYALARMLESESDDPKVRPLIGWITVHAARSWKKTLVRLLTGRSGQFGHQKYFYPDGRKEVRYASTAKEASPDARRLARALLEDRIRPPALLERTRPTAYVQMGRASRKKGPDGKPLQPAYDAARILKKQEKYGGIIGRVKDWFLYAQKAKPISDINDAVLL